MEEYNQKNADTEGQRLRIALEKLGYKPIDFAEKWSIKLSTVYATLNGQISTIGSKIEKACISEGVNLHYLKAGELPILKMVGVAEGKSNLYQRNSEAFKQAIKILPDLTDDEIGRLIKIIETITSKKEDER